MATILEKLEEAKRLREEKPAGFQDIARQEKSLWDRLKPYAGFVAAFGIPIVAGIVTRRRVRINTPDIERQVAEFQSTFERQLLISRVEKLKKDFPDFSKQYTKELRRLRRQKVPQEEAIRRALDTIEERIGKKIEIEVLPHNQYFYDNLDYALDRWIMGDPRELLYIAEKEWLPKMGRKAIPRWWHPQAVLRQEIPGTQLYNYNIELSREMEVFKQRLLNDLDDLVNRYKIYTWDDKTTDQFLFFHENKTRLTPEEIARFPRWMHELSEQYRVKITDPIWQEASKFDPNVRYRKDYFTHFVLPQHVRNIRGEIARLRELERADIPEVLRASLKTEIETLENVVRVAGRELGRLQELQDAAMKVLQAHA